MAQVHPFPSSTDLPSLQGHSSPDGHSSSDGHSNHDGHFSPDGHSYIEGHTNLEGHSNPAADFIDESYHDVTVVSIDENESQSDDQSVMTSSTDDLPPPYESPISTISSMVSLPDYTPKPDGRNSFSTYSGFLIPISSNTYIEEPTVFDSVIYPPPPPRYSDEPGWAWAPGEARYMVWPPVGDQAAITSTDGSSQESSDPTSPSSSNPPDDYRICAIVATICCCWMIGWSALKKSRECRNAIELGDYELAAKRSQEAKRRINCSICFGALIIVIVVGFIAVRYGMIKR